MASTSVAYSWLSPIQSFSRNPSQKVWGLSIRKEESYNHISGPKIINRKRRSAAPLQATLRSPKGFGPPKKNKKKTQKQREPREEDDDDEEEEEGREAGVIPEIVTNRMMSRVGFTVGVPLFLGLLFFPFFYYLKVVLKIDVPNWIPFIVSFAFFGTALLGVSYGIVSASWDPSREGSFWGWNEAQKNWPVFWQSFRGAPNNRK